jgi:hypothetical protein
MCHKVVAKECTVEAKYTSALRGVKKEWPDGSVLIHAISSCVQLSDDTQMVLSAG